MKRLALGLVFTLGTLGGGRGATEAWAQTAPSNEPAPSGGDATTKVDESASAVPSSAPAGQDVAVDRTAGWKDIVVVPRKPFIKDGRVELTPFTGISLNDSLIRHYSFGGELNYFLTDVLSVGLQGQYYLKELTAREGLAGLQYNRNSTINRYKFAGALNFGYVPGYGKFTLFNKAIVGWELLVSAGVGMVRTEIVPRKRINPAFHTDSIAANLGVGTRLFLSRWLTFNVMFRDYMFNDRFEPVNRMDTDTISQVEAKGERRFIHNMMLYAGLGIYLPPSFKYSQAR